MTDTKTRPLTEAELIAAHRHSMNNRSRLAGHCGCFYCHSTFPANRVSDWTDAGKTALCPVCGIDAVLSSATTPVTSDTLEQMHDRWFKQQTNPRPSPQ